MTMSTNGRKSLSAAFWGAVGTVTGGFIVAPQLVNVFDMYQAANGKPTAAALGVVLLGFLLGAGAGARLGYSAVARSERTSTGPK